MPRRPRGGGLDHLRAGAAESLDHIAGYAIEVRVNPAFVRGQEVARLRGSNARLRAVLGDAPGSIPLRETLRWMFAAS